VVEDVRFANPAYAEMNRDQIIDLVFATSNRDDLFTYLEDCQADVQYRLRERGFPIVNMGRCRNLRKPRIARTAAIAE